MLYITFHSFGDKALEVFLNTLETLKNKDGTRRYQILIKEHRSRYLIELSWEDYIILENALKVRNLNHYYLRFMTSEVIIDRYTFRKGK